MLEVDLVTASVQRAVRLRDQHEVAEFTQSLRMLARYSRCWPLVANPLYPCAVSQDLALRLVASVGAAQERRLPLLSAVNNRLERLGCPESFGAWGRTRARTKGTC